MKMMLEHGGSAAEEAVLSQLIAMRKERRKHGLLQLNGKATRFINKKLFESCVETRAVTKTVLCVSFLILFETVISVSLGSAQTTVGPYEIYRYP